MTNLQQIGIPLDVDFLDRKETGIPAGLFRISTRYAVEQSEEEKKKGDPPMLAEGKPEEFEVRAPQFALDDTLIPYLFPPEGASGDFSEVLAHVTIANDLLPWERSVDNTHPQADHPWLAVMIFAPGELAPSTTGEVSQFSSTERAKLPNIAFPNLSDYDIKQHAPQQVRTIDVPRKLFTQIAPTLDELPYTAHVRSVHEHHDTELYDAFRGDGEKLKIGNYSIVISNRFAKRPGCYVAHLVSLEACASYFDAAKYPNATHLRLISLREWSFDNHPEHTNTGFTPTVRHLAKPGHTDPNRLRLALTPATPPDNAHLRQRLEQGYVPLEYRVPTGERTFAWYSGPFTASRRRPNPWTQRLRYGDNGLIYLDKHGVFDISYAAAWALGRNLVLANAELSAQLNRARGHAWNILHDLVGSKPFMHLEAGLGTGSDTAADEASAALHVADRTGERLFLKMLHAGTADALIQTWATPQPPAANDSCPGTPGVGTPVRRAHAAPGHRCRRPAPRASSPRPPPRRPALGPPAPLTHYTRHPGRPH